MSKIQFRRLVVRAIEDIIIMASMVGGIYAVCGFFTVLFRALGVG